MGKFTIGQKVKIEYCHSRESLSGMYATITELESEDFLDFDYADNYNLPCYRVDIDYNFRPNESQLSEA